MSTLVNQSLQDQYYLSEWIFERFVSDLQVGNTALTRVNRVKTRSGLNAVLKAEDRLMNFSYFWKCGKDYKLEYRENLDKAIGRKKRLEFYDLVKNYWCDKSKRNHAKIQALEFSISEYLKQKGSRAKTRQQPVISTNLISIDSKDIAAILDITRRVFDRFIQGWVENHDFGSNDVYIYRGIELKNGFRSGQTYMEWRHINSYSLSISIGEQFVDTHQKQPVKAMLSINNNDLDNRILFFAPLIPGANPKQVELGVIPPIKNLHIRSKRTSDNFEDYVLGKTIRKTR